MPNRAVRPPLLRRLAAVGAAAALLAAAPAAADAAGWIDGSRFAMEYPAFGPDVAVAPDGSATAAWQSADLTTLAPQVHIQHAGPTGALGPVTTFAGTGPQGDQLDVDSGTGGASAVVWGSDPVGGRFETLRLALISPGGAVGPALAVASDLLVNPDPNNRANIPMGTRPAVAVDRDGDALVAWIGWDNVRSEPTAKAVRVGADGTVGSVEPLGTADLDEGVQVAVTPGGVGWVVWTDNGEQQVARFDAAGGLDGAEGVAALGMTRFPSVVAGENGGAVAHVDVVNSDGRIDGARLPLTGRVLGLPFSTEVFPVIQVTAMSTAPALAADGTLTIAWNGNNTPGAMFPVAIPYARIAPGAATAPTQTLPAVPGTLADIVPLLTPRPGGGTLALWVEMTRSSSRWNTATIAADGTVSPRSATGETALIGSLLGIFGPSIRRVAQPFALADGSATVATIDPIGALSGQAQLTLRRLDLTPPQLSANLPSSAVAGQPVAFSATATDDLSATTLWWDFGDDSGSSRAAVNHVYGIAGTYTVTVTAANAAGDTATATRQLTITAPTVPPGARRAAAGLKLTSAVRSGSTVRIAGTIAGRATGRVSLAYAQKDGRRTLTARTSAKIAKGRFSATLRLSRALAKRFRLKATVTASYAGDTNVDSATAKRTVTIGRAARRSAKKRR